MDSTYQPPYSKDEQKDAEGMQYLRTDNNGDRFYYSKAAHDEQPTFQKPQDQVCFYRAMNREEAVGWLSDEHTAKADEKGHHPWASYRNYSRRYLTRNYGYTHLIEVCAPGFVSQMMEVGFTSGKPEDGDLSWGIGKTNQNGFGPNSDTNRALAKYYDVLFNQNLVKTARKDVKGGMRGLAVEVIPFIFKQSITEVRLVDLRSQKP